MCGLQNFLLKEEQLLPLQEVLSGKPRMRKALGMSHLDSHVLCGSVDKEVMVMDKARTSLLRVPQDLLFNAASF